MPINIHNIARVITEDPDVSKWELDSDITNKLNKEHEEYLAYLANWANEGDESDEPNPEHANAIKKFAQIWDSYASIDPIADPVDDLESAIDEEPLYIMNLGAKWEMPSRKDFVTAHKLQPIVDDIVLYISETTGYTLETGWDTERGMSYMVGMDLQAGDIDEIEEYADEMEDEEDENRRLESPGYGDNQYDLLGVPPFEQEFMGGIDESASKIRYETLVHDLQNNSEAIQNIEQYTNRPFIKNVLNILQPKFQRRSGRFGSNTTKDQPAWYGANPKLHKYAQLHGGHFINIQLHDAEQEFPLDLHHDLQKSEHRVSGRAVAWAAGFLFPDKGILAIIEVQSDVMRQAPIMLKKSDQKKAVLEGFADWQDHLLKIIYQYAKEQDVTTIKLPTASKLGRYWRSAGENPNMKVLKTLYDKKLRGIAHKAQGWWVIEI